MTTRTGSGRSLEIRLDGPSVNRNNSLPARRGGIDGTMQKARGL